MRKPILAAVLATQVFFTLACGSSTGSSQSGNEPGQDGRLESEAPTTPERTDLVDDGRCDWLGAPFASASGDRAFVMRSSDVDNDCDGENRADHKVIFSLLEGTPRPILDVSALRDVRMLDTAAGLIVLSESGNLQSTWRIDHVNGAVLDDIVFPNDFQRTLTSPSREWVALGDNLQTLGHQPVQLLDPATLERTQLTPTNRQATFGWVAPDVLATFHVDDGDGHFALWDASEPSDPFLSLLLPGRGLSALESTPLVVSPDGRFAAVPVDGQQPGALIVDLDLGTALVVDGFRGPFAFTADGQLVGSSARRVFVADPTTGNVRTLEVGFASQFVPSTLPGQLLLTPAITDDCEPIATNSGGWFSGPIFAASCTEADQAVPEIDPGFFRLDLATGELLLLGEGSPLLSYTRRGDAIWGVDADRLVEFDLAQGLADPMDADTARHTLWIPSVDRIYLDQTDAPVVHLVDPLLHTVAETYDLSGPVLGSPSELRPL